MHRRLLGIVAALVLTGAGCINFGSSTQAGPMGVFRSGDKAETWAQANKRPTTAGVASLAGVKVYKLITDPSDPNALYLASRNSGLYYSYDRGDSWTKVAAFNDKFIYGVAVDPKNKCTLYVTDGSEIFKSVDCSRSWKRIYTEQRGQQIIAVAVDYGNSDMVFAGTKSGQILRSTNGGESWKSIKTFNTNMQVLLTDPGQPGRLYVAGANSGMGRSDDGGETWTSLTAGLQNFANSLDFYRLVLHPTDKDTLYWMSKYGILYSKDAGVTWTDLKLLSPPGSVNIYGFGISPKNPNEMYYTGTILGEKGASRTTFYKSVDGGKNWVTKKMPTNTVPVSIIVHPVDTNVLFMGFAVPDSK